MKNILDMAVKYTIETVCSEYIHYENMHILKHIFNKVEGDQNYTIRQSQKSRDERQNRETRHSQHKTQMQTINDKHTKN